jgi:hypothetical protein
MVDKKNLNRVKGILSARKGAEIPKYEGGNKIALPAFNPGDTSFQQWKSKATNASSNFRTAWRDYSMLKAEFPTASIDDLASYMDSGAGPGGVTLDSLYNKYTDAPPKGTNSAATVPGANPNMSIPGDPNLTPNTAVENAAGVNAQVADQKEQVVVAEQATNQRPPVQPIPEPPKINIPPASIYTNKENPIEVGTGQLFEQEQANREKKEKNWYKFGEITTEVFQGVGNAIGAKQAATDSNLTKGADAAYNMASDVVEKLGPIGKTVGTAMKFAGTAGNIIQELGGGTDQQTATDKWMDSSFFSWNIGMLNGFLGKKSDEFGVDQGIVSQVGSSYGGTTSDLNDAASKAGKKYGLFSSGARKRANKAIAEAKVSQNRMGDVADSANDQRMLVQSMGEQAGLNYSLMTDGGYNQKYTYAAKHGGLLEWNPTEELEWQPQVELNWELPTFKEGGNIDINEELEWIPEFKSGNKIRTIKELIEYAKKQNPRFIQRLSEEPRGIKFTDDEGNEAEGSHYLESRGEYVIPRIQEVNGELQFFNPQEAIDRAMESGNYLKMTPEEAIIFAEQYKQGWPDFFKKFKKGGSVGESDIPEIEETTQKNVIPEGALHKNKHHMEHAEGLTKKGIPVIDGEGEQQAEIEHSEIIFTLEVTKKLEEYYEIFYSDEATNKEKEQAAINAGKLLVYQILENTEDRTGLIESCKEGGSLKLKKSTDDLIEEVLEWMPTIVVIEEEKPKKKSEKDQMKEAIKEVLIELLVK